jgi:hypothetical protein
MYLPEDDRRFNVGDRQNVKLNKLWPNEAYVINHILPQELALFGLHIQHFLIDRVKARSVLQTEGKIAMREVSRTTIEDFVHAVKHGDLEFFLPIMDMPYQAPGAGYVLPAQTTMKEFIRDFDGKVQKLSIESLRILYVAFIGPSDNSNKFGKMLGKYGLPSARIRFGKVVGRGFYVQWNLNENNIEDLRERYLDAADHSFGTNLEPEKVVPLHG